ncbi:predicted protein [Naegleria gruberi]|uniref:Predicted protein n=1 Tax=Naegleria gruberi TaxID=5762 RepID=D2VH09_NAEGR|nr:uncharacterized protein NAEGRDRAFT_58206 [Naegleria gruberi]EFC43900.1 predicted protein [Naegleria gruberi]|eukprot:XP_002676644.1 predicted protein [Naegleria gruberi strain NEG-M]
MKKLFFATPRCLSKSRSQQVAFNRLVVSALDVRPFHQQFRCLDAKQNLDFSSKSLGDLINELSAMKVEPLEKRTTDKTREQLYYLYSIQTHVQNEIAAFQQQIEQITTETNITYDAEYISKLNSRFSLFLKWVLAIQQLTLDNGLFKLVQPLLIGEKADNFFNVLVGEEHFGKSHNFPLYYSLAVHKSKIRAAIGLGDYEVAKVACEELLNKISEMKVFYEKRQQEVDREEKEAATIGISLEEYKENQKKLKSKDTIEEVVNKIYELEQEQDIRVPVVGRKVPEFDKYFGVEPINKKIENQLDRLEVETQLTLVQVLYNISIKNEGSADSMVSWLDSRLRDAKLLGSLSSVMYKLSKASILTVQGKQLDEASKLYVESLQQIARNFPTVSKDLQQISTILLNHTLYATKKRNAAQDIHSYMKMIKIDNPETTPQVKQFVNNYLVDLFISRGQLDAALNYITQSKELQFNNGYFSPSYSSLLRREAEVLILGEKASTEEVISLLDNAIELHTEQYGASGRYLPLFYDLLVNYCKEQKINHEKLAEYSSAVSKLNIPELKREELLLLRNLDFVERDF